MTKKELLEKLEECRNRGSREGGLRYDPEKAHCEADDALLRYINDKEIEDAYDAIYKW